MEKNSHNTYSNPLTTRYASQEMNKIFSPEMKYITWRKLWLELARSQKVLGLPITQEQIDELESHLYDLNLDAAAEYEKRFRHDVMAHIHAYGDQCPKVEQRSGGEAHRQCSQSPAASGVPAQRRSAMPHHSSV